MAKENTQLCNIASRKMKQRLAGSVKLGDTLSELMEGRINPQQDRFGAVAEVWRRLLPVELCRHCRIADITGGSLKVLVDSPSYLYELRLCTSELLGEIQQQCPQVRIKKIKFTVG